jgi:hypothetical protein
MSAFDETFDYVQFVDEGFAAQSKYAKKAGEKWTPDELARVDSLRKVGGEETSEFFTEALDARYKKIIEHMGHLVEEMVEARVYVPRRSWKNNEPSYLDNDELRAEFVAECFDILLFHRAILAYAGVTGEEFLDAARAKMKYNSVRPDHNVNGTAEAERNPAAELQGDCPSADYAMKAYQESGPKHSASTFHHPV